MSVGFALMTPPPATRAPPLRGFREGEEYETSSYLENTIVTRRSLSEASETPRLRLPNASGSAAITMSLPGYPARTSLAATACERARASLSFSTLSPSLSV